MHTAVKNRVSKVYNFSFWAGIATIIIWIILKASKIIQSPPLTDLIPIIAAIIVVLSFWGRLNKWMGKIDWRVNSVEREIAELKKITTDSRERIIRLEENVKLREREVEKVSGRPETLKNPKRQKEFK